MAPLFHTVGMVPPSMTYSLPVVADARSEARKATSSATSSGQFGRPSGMPPRESQSLPTRRRGARAIPLWLPAAAQGLIELDQREQFIASGLRQAQLCVEQVTVGIERIEQRIDAAPVAHVGEL